MKLLFNLYNKSNIFWKCKARLELLMAIYGDNAKVYDIIQRNKKMATILIRKERTKTHSISIEQENTLLIVLACPIISDCLVGYPQSKMTYNYKDIKNAQATFRRYLKKYL